jgi:prepilin-type N-terminal cleavage/methylation domain-containing protein
MFIKGDRKNKGFTLIELVVIIVVLGILAAIAIPKLFSVTKEAEKASVNTMLANLESALSAYTAKQFVNGQSIVVHNPFDDLSNVPSNYKGVNDPVTLVNTPNGSWTYRPTGNWIMYNPKSSITGGWLNGEPYIAYQIQVVTDGPDTVGLRLNTTPAYTYTW